MGSVAKKISKAKVIRLPIYAGIDPPPRRLMRTRVIELAELTAERRAVTDRATFADRYVRALADFAGASLDDVLLQATLEADPAPACKLGCAHCCHLRVEVLPIEAVRLAQHVRSSWSAERVKALLDRLETNVERTRGLSAAAHLTSGTPCALLGSNGVCTVYSVRPLSCRAWHSCDAAACEAALESETPVQVPVIADVWGNGEASRLGFREAMIRLGKDGSPCELQHALLIALRAPDAAERWLAGGEVLAAARTSHRADRSRDARSSAAHSSGGKHGRASPRGSR